MSHLIDGTRSANALTLGWTKIGTVMSEEQANDPNFEPFLAAAQMDYTIAHSDVVVDHGLGDDGSALDKLAAMANADSVFSSDELHEIVAALAKVPGQKHLVRSDDKRVVSPSTVSNGYGSIHPTDLANALRPWVASGWARWDSMFVLRNGSEEIVTVKLQLPEEFRNIDGDKSGQDCYLLLRNRHGRGSVQGVLTWVRAVCANTVAMAIGGGIDFSVRHGRNVVENLAEATEQWEAAKVKLAEYKRRCGILIGVECDIENAVNVALGLDPAKKDDWTGNERNRRDDVLAQTNRPERGTYGRDLYDVWNAVTNVLTHGTKHGKTVEKRLQSQLDGSRGKLERAAFDRLGKLAESLTAAAAE